MALTRQNRFKKVDFDNLFKKGKTISGELVFLKLKRNYLNDSRFCFVVGLKTSKKATQRNKIKRRLRGIIRENLINIKSGFDIAVISKPVIINKKYKEIKRELEKLFQKAKIYK